MEWGKTGNQYVYPCYGVDVYSRDHHGPGITNYSINRRIILMKNLYVENTLEFKEDLCTGCGMCGKVCPHRVFMMNGKKAECQNPQKCMECGACQLNCPAGAIVVKSGVGCAAAMIVQALTGRKEAVCGSVDEEEKGTTCGCGESSKEKKATRWKIKKKNIGCCG
jgi:ferredoxin